MALMLEENTGQLARKGNPRLLTVVLHPRVFSSVTRISRARMPAATFGALVGKVTRSGAMPQVANVEAVPMEIALAAARNKSWQSLKERLASEGAGLELVGWFYADPGIGVFPPQVDAAEIHKALSPEARILLLANPSTEAGGFYVLKRGRFETVGGFYEAMTLQKPAPDIAWNGEVPGGEEWLHSPGTEMSSAAVGALGEPAVEGQPGPNREWATNGAAYAAGPSEIDQLTGRTARSGRVDPWASEESPTDHAQAANQAPGEVPQRVRKALDDARAAITAMEETPDRKAPKVRRAMATRPLAEAMLPPAEEMSPPTLAPASTPTEPKQTNPLEKPVEVARPDFSATKLMPVDAATTAQETPQPAPAPEKKRRGIGIMVAGLVGLLGVIAIAVVIGAGVLNLQGTTQPAPVATVSSGGVASPTAPSGSGQPGFTPTAAAGQVATGNASRTPSPTSTSTSTPTEAYSPTATATLTPVPTETPTQVPSTLTLTPSPVPPTATFTPVPPPPPTFTRVPPRPTFTPRPPTPKPAYIYYTVQSGDTLSGIAYRFRTTVNAIMLANRLSSTYIYRGQVLAIPNR